MELSNRLKEFIESKNLTIKEFAEKINMSYESLQPYTNNRRNPGLSTLKKLYNEGCDLNWLITGEKVDLNSKLEKRINELQKILKNYGIKSPKELELQLRILNQIKSIIETKMKR